MFLKNKLEFLNFFLSKFKGKSYREIDKKYIKKIISLFKPYEVNIPLIRIGSENDGGYLLPNILDKLNYCFSPGVGNKSDFEKDLEKFGIKSFLADKSVDKPATKLKNFQFDKINIHSFNSLNKKNINDWIFSKINKNQIDQSILQIDTDGFEYEMIFSLNEEILSKIKILIIEFHGLEFIGNEYFANIVSSTVEKIKEYHTVAHIHPNNCCGIHEVGGYKIPSVLEVTFINNNIFNTKYEVSSLPNVLDNKNVKKNNDIKLREYWFK